MAFVNYLNLPFGNYSVEDLIKGLNLANLDLDFQVWLKNNSKLLFTNYLDWEFSYEASGIGLSYKKNNFKPIKIGLKKAVNGGEVMTLPAVVLPLINKSGYSFEEIQLIDATAGLLNDSFSLLELKVPLVAYEANVLLAFFIQISLALNSTSLMFKFSPHKFESNSLEEYLKKKIILIYDPMFLMPKVKSLPSKEMQLLSLLNSASSELEIDESEWNRWRKNTYAILVKRPDKGTYLLNQKPNYSIESKLLRWDVYRN